MTVLDRVEEKIVSYYKNGSGAFNKRKLTKICKELRRIVENLHKMQNLRAHAQLLEQQKQRNVILLDNEFDVISK